jgi:hypothetical protein
MVSHKCYNLLSNLQSVINLQAGFITDCKLTARTSDTTANSTSLRALQAAKLKVLRLPDVPEADHKLLCKVIRSSKDTLQAVDLSSVCVSDNLDVPLEENPLLDALRSCSWIQKLAYVHM